MIARHGPCWGVTVFQWGRVKVELWYAPASYATPEHAHDNSDGEFTVLWAKNRPIYRRIGFKRECYIAHTPGVWGRWFSVRAGTPHAFLAGTSCMIWLCVQRWHHGVPITSVADDFRLT